MGQSLVIEENGHWPGQPAKTEAKPRPNLIARVGRGALEIAYSLAELGRIHKESKNIR